MKSIQLLAIPLVVAICVSTSFGQETKTKVDKKGMAKAAKSLQGTWVGDADKTAEEIKKSKDLELSEEMVEMMLEQISSIEIKFDDGEFNVVIGEREMAGEWKVKELGKKFFVVDIVPDDDEEKSFEIHFLGKKHMKMVEIDGENPPIVMKRKASDKKDK